MRRWSNTLRISGYLVAMTSLLIYMMIGDSGEDAQLRYLTLGGCLIGFVCAVTGIVLRYWPESERRIRECVAREYEEGRKDEL